MKGRKMKLRNYAKEKVKGPEKRLGVVTAEEKKKKNTRKRRKERGMK